MASHEDMDAANKFAEMASNKDSETYTRLQERGVEMMKRRLSTITAGDETDQVLFEKQNGKVNIKQLSVDPDCLRISIGEANTSEREKYLVFRGDPRRARTVLQRMIRELDDAIKSGCLDSGTKQE